MNSWENWAGSVRCHPHTIALPESEAEVAHLVREAAGRGQKVRVVGTGHSFVPLCATDGLLLSLDKLQGVLAVDSSAQQATVWAGSKISQLGDPLYAAGLSMENMGDIDRQAIGGAIATGTHGTGRTLGSISTQVVGLRLITADGEPFDCTLHNSPDLLRAAVLSLGALGVVTQVTLRLLPAYRLHERTWVASFEECMAELESHIASNRHFEFFWSPREDGCAMKTLNPVSADAELHPPAGNRPVAEGRLARYVREERIDASHRIFPSERNLRFHEIEFALPADRGPECLREVRQLMQERYPDVVWPIEYRTLAADQLDLSPAYGRDTVTISVHQAAELPYQSFFADVEAIFRNHHGRPHWGKIHTHSAHELRSLYPMWDHFQTVRQELDPDGVFLNEYLQSLLGT